MATTTMNYGAFTAMTCTMANLGNGSYRQSAVVDNTADKYMDALVGGSVQSGTTPTAGGTVEFYAYGQRDTGDYTGGASGSDGAYTDNGGADELRLVGVVTVTSTSNVDYSFGPWSVAAAFGGVLPSKWGLVVKNGTGVTLHATGTNNELKYQGVKFDIA